MQGFTSRDGDAVFGFRAPAFERLGAFEVAGFFELARVRGEIAVADIEQRLQLVEREALVHGERAHDAEAYALVHQPIETRVFGGLRRPRHGHGLRGGFRRGASRPRLGALGVAGFTACNSGATEVAKQDAVNLNTYVDSVEKLTPVYTVANWSTVDNGYQERAFSGDSSVGELYTTYSDDTEMNHAISEAKHNLFVFDTAFQSGNSRFSDFSIKKRFVLPDNGGEHIWISILKAVKNGYRGTISNAPVSITGIKFGDTVFVDKKDISDWMYIDADTLRGGYTMRLELKRMRPEEKAEALKSLDFKIEE